MPNPENAARMTALLRSSVTMLTRSTFQQRRWLVDRKSHRAVGTHVVVSIPDRGDRIGRVRRRRRTSTTRMADQRKLLLEAWPNEVAGPIAAEIHNVLTTARGDVLTVGVVLAIYFASSGVESLRIGLNRAYGMAEQRHWMAVAARIDCLRAGRSDCAVGAGIPGRARAADLRRRGPPCTVARRRPLPILNFLRIATAGAVLVVALFVSRINGCRPAGAACATSRRASLRPWCCGWWLAKCSAAISPIRLCLCDLLCRACVANDRAGVSLHHGGDLHLRRRAQRRDHARTAILDARAE